MLAVRSGFDALPEVDQDQRVLIHQMSWWQYETVLAVRGDNPVPRIAYAHGTIELMSPCHRHEERKSLLGRLVEAYTFERGIYFVPWGSTTLENQSLEKGAEPDESYAFSKGAKGPDLAIEAVLTSGGLDKLDLYARLGVPEVWFWFESGVEAYRLEDGRYRQIEESSVLPGLRIEVIDEYARREDVIEAVMAFRRALSASKDD